VRLPDGRTEYLVGTPDALPDVPQGATVVQDFPLGRMRMDKIGTGEGNQAFGHGLYTAEAEAIGKSYRDALTKDASNVTIDGQPLTKFYYSSDPEEALKAKVGLAVREGKDINAAIDWVELQIKGQLESRRLDPAERPYLLQDLQRLAAFREAPPDIRQNLGRMYELNIKADPELFLDWDKPLSEQTSKVREAFSGVPIENPSGGGHVWQSLVNRMNAEGAFGEHIADLNPAIKTGPKAAMEYLRDAGIPGIKYFDAGSRAAGEGTRNYVVFDENLIEILRKYGIVPAALGIGAASTGEASAETPKKSGGSVTDRARMILSRKA
jgi:hypothetical protein